MLLHYLYWSNCFQKKLELDSLYEVSFSCGCSLSLSIYHTTMHARDTVVTSGLVLLVATWNCWISYKNGYAGLLVLHLLPLLNPLLVIKMWPLYRYYFGRCSSELAQLVPLPYSRGRSTRYLIDCIISL